MKQLAVYDEIRSQLDALQKENSTLVFEYDTPKGEKAARSHIYKLRQTKTAIEEARKREKAESLEYGRRVDSEARLIVEVIDAMIDVHAEPLREIEAREAKRVEGLRNNMQAMVNLIPSSNEDVSAKELEDRLQQLETYRIGPHWQEFELNAARIKEGGIETLREMLAKRRQYEAERDELERLRREQEAAERADRERRIAEEAKARAEEEAAQTARAIALQVELREKALKEQLARAEEDRKRAEEDRKRDAEIAEAKAIRAAHEARDAQRREEEEARLQEERRAADRVHAAQVNSAAVNAVMEIAGLDTTKARLVIGAIIKGEIPNVSISY